MPVNWSWLTGWLCLSNHVSFLALPHVPSLSNLWWRVIVVSRSELIVADSEHTCCNIILIYYVTYIYHWIHINEENSDINIKMLLCHLSDPAVNRNASKLEPAYRMALLIQPCEFPGSPTRAFPRRPPTTCHRRLLQRAHHCRQWAHVLQHYPNILCNIYISLNSY